MKKILMTILILSILSTVVVAQTNETKPVQENEICTYVKNTFKIGGEIPGFLPYGNDAINFYDMQNNLLGILTTENSILQEMQCDESTENANYKVIIKDLATIKGIVESEHQLDELNKAIKEGRIDIEGIDFGTNTNVFFTKLAVTIGSWFS